MLLLILYTARIPKYILGTERAIWSGPTLFVIWSASLYIITTQFKFYNITAFTLGVGIFFFYSICHLNLEHIVNHFCGMLLISGFFYHQLVCEILNLQRMSFCYIVYIIQIWTFQLEYMSHVTRKLVFGFCDQLILKPACSADETS